MTFDDDDVDRMRDWKRYLYEIRRRTKVIRREIDRPLNIEIERIFYGIDIRQQASKESSGKLLYRRSFDHSTINFSIWLVFSFLSLCSTCVKFCKKKIFSLFLFQNVTPEATFLQFSMKTVNLFVGRHRKGKLICLFCLASSWRGYLWLPGTRKRMKALLLKLGRLQNKWNSFHVEWKKGWNLITWCRQQKLLLLTFIDFWDEKREKEKLFFLLLMLMLLVLLLKSKESRAMNISI